MLEHLLVRLRPIAKCLAITRLTFCRDCAKPKLFVSGARDQFGPRAKLEALVASVPEPKKLVVIEGADHFFEGRLRELREAIEVWVSDAMVCFSSSRSLPRSR